MKEIIETMPRIELALIIIGVFVLISCIIFGYAMIHEYRMYLVKGTERSVYNDMYSKIS